MQSLENVEIGKYYTINSIDDACSVPIKRRLFDLGFISGQQILVRRKSLLGKVFLIELQGYTLSLQKQIAKLILVGV